jgi:hypothetical protein
LVQIVLRLFLALLEEVMDEVGRQVRSAVADTSRSEGGYRSGGERACSNASRKVLRFEERAVAASWS